MERKFVIISHVPTKAVDEGFIPSIFEKGLSVILLTDKDIAHAHLTKEYAEKINIIRCDVFNPISIINTLNDYQISPIAIFSNSDHLQSATSIAASFYKLPTKSWKCTQITKNKSLMRQILSRNNLSNIWQYTINNHDMLNSIIEKLTYPLIAKPCLGVASIGVKKIDSQLELIDYVRRSWSSNKNAMLNQTSILLEKYVNGIIYSLETIGNGEEIQILGGFQTRLSQLPYFIEIGAQWHKNFPFEINQQLLNKLKCLGVNFGSCHTEFVIDRESNMVDIIEVNYRSAGDQKEFILELLHANQYFNTIIDLYLGKKDINLKPIFNAAEIEYLLPNQSGFLKKSPKSYSIVNNLSISSFVSLKNAGEIISKTNSNEDYLGILHTISQDPVAVKKILNQQKYNLEWEIDYV